MKATREQIEIFLPQLEDNPRRIGEAAAGFDEAALHRPLDRQSWSAAEILAHVRSCAEIWTFSIYAMLAENEPSLAVLDPRRWAKATGYSRAPFSETRQAYALQRLELVRVLRSLPFEAWSLSAQIGGRQHTVFTQVRRIAKHEDEHCLQIEEALRFHSQVR